MASGTIKAVVGRSDIVNNLTTNDSTKVLSAAQGYALNSNLNNIYRLDRQTDANAVHSNAEANTFYRTVMSANSSNMPNTNAFWLEGNKISDNYGVQVAVDTETGYQYRRFKWGTVSWGNWESLNVNIGNLKSKYVIMNANNAITLTRADQHQSYIISGSSSGGEQTFIVASNGGIANLGGIGKAAWSNDSTTLTVVFNTQYRQLLILSSHTINHTLGTQTYATFADGSSTNLVSTQPTLTAGTNFSLYTVKSNIINKILYVTGLLVTNGAIQKNDVIFSLPSGVNVTAYVTFTRNYGNTSFVGVASNSNSFIVDQNPTTATSNGQYYVFNFIAPVS